MDHSAQIENSIASVSHFGGLVVLAISLLFFILPLIIIIRRTGRTGWWILFTFIPVLGLFGPWLLAVSRWPALEPKVPRYR